MYLRHCEVKFLVEPDINQEAKVAEGAACIPGLHHHDGRWQQLQDQPLLTKDQLLWPPRPTPRPRLRVEVDVKPSCGVIDEVEGVVAPGEQVGEDRPEEDRLVTDDVQQPCQHDQVGRLDQV